MNTLEDKYSMAIGGSEDNEFFSKHRAIHCRALAIREVEFKWTEEAA